MSLVNSFVVEVGKPALIRANRPMAATIRTACGSTLSFVVTPNNPLELISSGDIQEVTLTYEDTLPERIS